MKKNLIVLSSCLFLLFTSSVIISGCNENPLQITESVSEVQDNFESESRSRLQRGYLYITFGSNEYQSGAAFYEDRTGHLKSDLPSNARIIGYRAIGDSVLIRFTYLESTFTLTAYLTTIQYTSVPERTESRPFNGLGIVRDINLAYLYSEQREMVKVMTRASGLTEYAVFSAERIGDTVAISDGRAIHPNPIVPNPWQTNVHSFVDQNGGHSSYLPRFPF